MTETKFTIEDRILEMSAVADQIGDIAFGVSQTEGILNNEMFTKIVCSTFYGIEKLCRQLCNDLEKISCEAEMDEWQKLINEIYVQVNAFERAKLLDFASKLEGAKV